MLLHHALPQGDATSFTAALGGSGWLGVSLFFVLSGFLLTVRYAPNGALRGTPRTFLLERVARLAPTYLLALLFAAALFARDARVQGLAAGHVTAIVSSVLTVQQAWRPETACQWNCPAWSLSVEAWFYLAFPLVIAGLGAWLLRGPARAAMRRGAMLLVVSLLASALIFPNGERFGGSWPVPVYSLSPLARWPEFLAGIGLAAVLRDWRPTTRVPGLFLLAVGLGWLALAVSARGFVAANGLHLLPVALPGFVLVVGACWGLREHPGLGLHSATLVLLGEASYALYLFHAPLHGYLLAATNRLVGRGYDASWPLFAAYLAVAVLLAVGIHRAFELPWRRRLRIRFGLSGRTD
ncbi:MAG: acyltransferase [Gemmatimonadaceae bacterium]|nr:acyltransferase [Gemmatimonadaceae bacterium]